MVSILKIDRQGRIIIPKELRERKRFKGEVEVVEVKEGVLIRPPRREWDKIFANKVEVNWRKVLAVSLENVSIDDLLFGVG